ncbi:hypothetical protein ARMSODRAFT_1026887 [Armillaria solidipes]|uniref:Uncharacterized protein n=1 Tax=Armillaria solidipes TaxID=1076256 RepID=A0A2H3AR55_9AGAR|nr:hypothetical protein ARMSODRAFT_1026887 [Armillaria solidipes]
MTCFPPSRLPPTVLRTDHLHCHGQEQQEKSSLPPPNDLMTSTFPHHAETSKSTLIDTHTHLLLTFALYRSKYPEGQYDTAFDFVEGLYSGTGVETIIDVWCEPEVLMRETWKELADRNWEGVQYQFVIGVHPYILRL